MTRARWHAPKVGGDRPPSVSRGCRVGADVVTLHRAGRSRLVNGTVSPLFAAGEAPQHGGRSCGYHNLATRPSLRLIRLGIVVRFHHLFPLGFLCYSFNLAFPAAANGVAPFSAEQGFYRLATNRTAFAHQTEMAGPTIQWFHLPVSSRSLSP